jgi:Ca2+-binding RTX toxin-like protein
MSVALGRLNGDGDGGNDIIKSGKGNDINFGDNQVGSGAGGDDKINAGQGDDELTGGGGEDKFKCGNGQDTITDFNKVEGDKATGNCEIK